MTNYDFCQHVCSMIGQPYSQTDCIGLIRKAAGIRCQGTNWLWRSFDSSGKYRYLIHRLERPPTKTEIYNGLLVFRIRWDQIPPNYSDKPNCHHVGVIVGKDVIHSSSVRGKVIREPYEVDDWSGAGWLKFIDAPDAVYIDPDPDQEEERPAELSDHDMLLAIYNKLIID